MAKSRKKKSQAPTALVYFVTLIVFIVLLGAVAITIMNRYVLNNDSSGGGLSSGNVKTEFQNSTYLYMLESDKKELEALMTVRMIPEDGKILLVPLSPYTMAADASQTFAQTYKSGGASALTETVSKTLDLSVDRYLSMNHAAFADLCDTLASITYEVVEDMYYVDKNSDDVVNYEKGDKISPQGDDIRLLITYPSYSEGYSQNVKASGELMRSVVNTAFKLQSTRDGLKSIFSSMIASATEKNFTQADFDEYSEGYYNIIDNFDNPADIMTPTGAWSEKGDQFTVDDNFKAQLKSAFE